MEIKNTDLVSLFEQSLKDVPQEKLEEIGIVVKLETTSVRSRTYKCRI